MIMYFETLNNKGLISICVNWLNIFNFEIIGNVDKFVLIPENNI